MSEQSFKEVLDGLSDQLTVLIFSGVAGAFFRAILAPESHWKRRVVQGVAGAISALFLGGLLGHIINSIVNASYYGFAAGGFIMGSGGEVAVKALQDRIMGKDKG